MKIKSLLLMFMLLAICSCAIPSGERAVRLEKGLPTMLTLGAGYCQYCKAMRPSINKLSAEYRGKVNVVYADTKSNPEYARRYRAEGVPFTVLLDKNERLLFSQLGYLSEAEMRQYIKRYFSK